MFKLILLTILIQVTFITTQRCNVRNEAGFCSRINQCPDLKARLKRRTGDDIRYIKSANNACRNTGGAHSLCCLVPPTTTLSCGKLLNPLTDRVSGGVTAQIGAWPWMVALLKTNNQGQKDFFCGGTLISDQHVLTAAHCLEGENAAFARVGEHDLSSRKDCYEAECSPPGVTKDYRVARTFNHPRYKQNCNGVPCNDIAILKLQHRVRLDGLYVHHICLPENLQRDLGLSLDTILSGTNGAIVAGWGKTKSRGGQHSNLLQQARVILGDSNRCEKFIRSYPVKESIICAGDCQNGPCKDTCTGDSGGPLMISDRTTTTYYILGITSSGLSLCGINPRPGVTPPDVKGRYTNVNHYVTWIRCVMRTDSVC